MRSVGQGCGLTTGCMLAFVLAGVLAIVLLLLVTSK